MLAIDDRTELRAAVTDHIRTVMRRYRGAVDRWDVLNEPLQTLGADLYDNHFRQVFGDDYISEMFAIAHEADPAARLFLNESTVELLPDKAAALVALVKDLREHGAPIDGVGIQAHLVAGTVDSGAVRRLIDDLEGLGVEVAITELDIPITSSADPHDTGRHVRPGAERMPRGDVPRSDAVGIHRSLHLDRQHLRTGPGTIAVRRRLPAQAGAGGHPGTLHAAIAG